mmetsp:Transcript_11742/g.20411  ORF Transcript_11742/g.20411 Transcript_11742/m.20411 type:complete len:202 (-) Transcript_11742:577-1182(-)
MLRGAYFVFSVLGLMFFHFAAVSAVFDPKVVGCYDEPATDAAQVPEGTAIYQTFDAQLSGSILRVTLYMSWTRGDQVQLSLCEGSDISKCENEQTVGAKPKGSFRPELTWTEFELDQSIHMASGVRYFLKWLVIKGSNVRFGVTAFPWKDCDWSWGYLQDGRVLAAVQPSPRFRYRLTVVEDCPEGFLCGAGRRRLRGQHL